MFSFVIKVIAVIALAALIGLIFIKVLPFLLLVLAAVGVWKIYQALSRRNQRPPEIKWPRL